MRDARAGHNTRMDPDDPGALLRALVHNSFDVITVSNGEGILQYVSPSVERVLGYRPASVVGKSILSFVHPDDASHVGESFARAVATPGVRDPTVLRARHADGTWRVMEAASNNLLADPSVSGIVHNMRDVTVRAEAEAAVHQSEQKFRSYLDQATDLIWTLSPDARFTSVNAATCEAVGYEPHELIGRSAFDLVAPEDQLYVASRFAEILAGNTIDRLDVQVVTRPGDRIWLEIRGRGYHDGDRIFEILQIARDVTERRRSEEAIRESEGLYRAILNSSPDAVVVTDMQGHIQMSSPAGLKMFGHPALDELIGRSIFEFITPEDHDRARANIAGIAVRGTDWSNRHPDEYDGVRADGAIFKVEVMGEFLRDAAGQPRGMVFDVRDISERKEAEAERSRLEAQLAQAQKMEAIGQLAGGVAHDFNNMLGVILASAELALQSLDTSSPAQDEIAEIIRAARRSADLTRQLLAFARKQLISPAYLDLNEAVPPMMKMLGRLIRADTQLSWNPASQPCPVYVDAGQVDQILANLVVNARDALAGAGAIAVSAEVVEVTGPDATTIGEAAPGTYVVLSVSDDGPGMSEAIRTRAFEPFFTTKPLGEGTGLGLATVYGIAQQNHGFVSLKTRPGAGTRVSVYLPIHPIPPAPASSTPDEAEGAAPGETILLVEDEPALLRLTARLLGSLGYTVLTAESPEAAIRLVQETRSNIDLMVSDMMMPGMNGLDLLAHLQDLRPAMRCLFVSGYSAEAVVGGGALPPFVLLQKPYTREALAAKVREVLAQQR